MSEKSKKVTLTEVYEKLYKEQEAKKAKDKTAKALDLTKNVKVEIIEDFGLLKKGAIKKVSKVVAEYYKANKVAKEI